MNTNNVRIKSIEMKNFKNVQHGKIILYKKIENRSNLLALYGQNGSGKTALIEALQLLKLVLCGQPIPAFYTDYIYVESKKAEFTFTFDVQNEQGYYEVIYHFCLSKQIESMDNNADISKEHHFIKAKIENEVLSSSFESENEKIRRTKIIDTDCESVFGPDSKYLLLVGSESEKMLELLVSKKLSSSMSKSFIFSRELLSMIRKRKEYFENQDIDQETLLFDIYHQLIEQIVLFGNTELFVISTRNTGMISLDVQPFIFKYHDKIGGMIGNYIIPLDEKTVIPTKEINIVNRIINAMNVVLVQIIPGLRIGIKEIGQQVLPDNKEGCIIQLMAIKKGQEIPLKYESEGIKKIISILQMLISVYNESSITVAIDELDSGIFEYLLGELLRILDEKGKGQLIFTSHNLRPLETIHRDFIAFTTVNPQNRYMRLKNIQSHNNLRDVYYRDIVLGGQYEDVYDFVHNAEIDFAFQEAGMSENE